MQSRTTMRYNCTPTKKIENKQKTVLSAEKDMEQLEQSYVSGGNAKLYSYFGKPVLNFLIKLNIIFI